MSKLFALVFESRVSKDFVLFFAMFSGFVRLLDFFLFLIYGEVIAGVSNDSADGDAGGGEIDNAEV